MVAHFECGVIVNERCFKLIYPDPVDATLFTVKLDPVQVDHCREDGQLHISLQE